MVTTSTHRVEVVPVILAPHPNADSLSIVRVWGYTVVVRTADWPTGQLGAYIVPDSVVDTTRPAFAFLAGHERVRVRRFRGVLSQGLLIPAPDGAQLGEDVAEALGVTRYEPPPLPVGSGGEAESPPPGYRPVYDVESWARYGHVLTLGEEVVITEKLHGANGRWGWANDRFYAGSRTEWKRRDDGILWWRAVATCPEIEAACRAHPDLTLYGEVYGSVQDLTYGCAKGEVRVAIFDALRGNEWLPLDDLMALRVPHVPVLYAGCYAPEFVRVRINGPSVAGDGTCLREGVVIRPREERTHPEVGRVILKAISDDYLERSR